MINDNRLPPVVFVHGWKASTLIDRKTQKEKYNLSLSQLLGFGDDTILSMPLEFDKDGNQINDTLEPGEPLTEVKCCCDTITLANLYGPMIRHCQKTRDFHTFVYDWRRCLDETRSKFETFLESFSGEKPQVIAHSMGCLITLSLLNKRPDLFHSVLFGAPAYCPNVSVLEDLSLPGRVNVIGANRTIFSPRQHISSPSPFHFITSLNERERYGKETTDMLRDEHGKPLHLDLHKLETWKELKIGMYHPDSGVQPDQAKEEWMQAILNKCLSFRKSLMPSKEKAYPPVAVLVGNHTPTIFGFVQKKGLIDFDNPIKMPGDGRVVIEDALPPKGIPVCKVWTNDREHSLVLNDLEKVDELLKLLISEKEKNH